MPCGGIYPTEISEPNRHTCWACNKGSPDHFMEEWDAFIHGTCVREFLKTEEGQIVVLHKHHIQIGEEILQEEGKLNEALRYDPFPRGGPPGPGRVWRYNNSDYSWQTAKDIEELKALPWLVEFIGAMRLTYGTCQLMVSIDGALRAPWDRNLGLKVLMLVYDDGLRWCVLGGLENPELYGLPTWDARLAPAKQRSRG